MGRTAEAPQRTPEQLGKLRHKKAEVLHAVTPVVEQHLHLLLDPATAWEPSTIMPDPHSNEFGQIRQEAKLLSPEMKIVLVGSLITEEGLPNFTAEIARFGIADGIAEDKTSPWEIWRRGWAGEEGRHGKLLDMYLRDSDAFNVTQIERDVHSYVKAGFYPSAGRDSYGALMFTAWQEPATQESHKGEAKLGKEVGAPYLHRAFGVMAGDEGRHSAFYEPVVGEIIKIDPEGAVESLWNLVVKSGLIMPGENMHGFNAFTEASTLSGAYGLREYVATLGKLIKGWGIEELKVGGVFDQMRHEIIRKQQGIERIADRARKKPKSDDLLALEQRWLKP